MDTAQIAVTMTGLALMAAVAWFFFGEREKAVTFGLRLGSPCRIEGLKQVRQLPMDRKTFGYREYEMERKLPQRCKAGGGRFQVGGPNFRKGEITCLSVS